MSNDDLSSLLFKLYPESCFLVVNPPSRADFNVAVISLNTPYFKYLPHVQQHSVYTHKLISLHQTRPAPPTFTSITQQSWFLGFRADKSFASELRPCLLMSASGWLIKFKAPVPSLSILDRITQRRGHCVQGRWGVSSVIRAAAPAPPHMQMRQELCSYEYLIWLIPAVFRWMHVGI